MHGNPIEALAFIAFCGLLRPREWRARALVRQSRLAHAGDELARDVLLDRSVAPAMSLNSIELALIAEYSLEMARANEAVADDTTKQVETRRRASEVAAAWRQRAQHFHMQARSRSAEPILPIRESIHAPGRAYTGPERRRQLRRTQTRRTGPLSASASQGRGDRRAGAERRRRDRRRPELAPR